MNKTAADLRDSDEVEARVRRYNGMSYGSMGWFGTLDAAQECPTEVGTACDRVVPE